MTSTTPALGPGGGGPGPEIVPRREALEAEPTPCCQGCWENQNKGKSPRGFQVVEALPLFAATVAQLTEGKSLQGMPCSGRILWHANYTSIKQ